MVISERYIPAGSLDKFKVGYLPAVDYLMKNVKGCKAVFVSQDKSDPTLLHDVQIFNDTEAFHQHADPSNEPLMMTIMGWMSGLDPNKPLYGDQLNHPDVDFHQ